MTAERIVGEGLDPSVARKSAVQPPRPPGEIRVQVQADSDVVTARNRGRAFAKGLGFTSVEATIVATVVSELARQVLRDAGRGEIIVAAVDDVRRRGMTIRVRHEGQGTMDRPAGPAERRPDVGTAGRGRWLDGPTLLIDELEIVSHVGRGTTLTVRIWKDEAPAPMGGAVGH